VDDDRPPLNALRELAGVKRLVEDQVPTRPRTSDRRGLANRPKPIVEELSSRMAKMTDAAQRGVRTDIVLDPPLAKGGRLDGDAAQAFAALGTGPRFWAWPAEHRAIAGGGTAAMHAKAAVAEGGGAGRVSQLHRPRPQPQLGTRLLIEGAPVPTRIAAHSAALMGSGELVPL